MPVGGVELLVDVRTQARQAGGEAAERVTATLDVGVGAGKEVNVRGSRVSNTTPVLNAAKTKRRSNPSWSRAWLRSAVSKVAHRRIGAGAQKVGQLHDRNQWSTAIHSSGPPTRGPN
jgi:hypothetical protein